MTTLAGCISNGYELDSSYQGFDNCDCLSFEQRLVIANNFNDNQLPSGLNSSLSNPMIQLSG
jgi:hypothetical protein